MIEFALPAPVADPLPDPAQDAPPATPAIPWLDTLRIEQARNRFIAHQQDVLHGASDAFLNRQGWDAVDGAHDAVARLHKGHDALLDEAPSPDHRALMREALAPTLGHATDRILRHAAAQSFVGERHTAQHRLDLLGKQAAHDYADPDLVHAYADSAVTTLPDRPDHPNVADARSTIYRRAIEAAFGTGNADAGHSLYMQTLPHLVGSDRAILDPLIDHASRHRAGHGYFKSLSGALSAALSLAEAQAAHDAASAQNATDWAHDDTQRDTNQHIIDVLFGRLKRQAERARIETANAVEDWLARPGVDGEPQTERPPFALWNRLSPDQRRAVDARLARNARGDDARDRADRRQGAVLHANSAIALRPPAAAIPHGGPALGARLAPLIAGGAGALIGALPLLVIPTNSQRQTFAIGEDLRVHKAPGQRSAVIERRVGKGLFGSGIGEKWERAPVEVDWGHTPEGRQALLVNPADLERAFGPDAHRILEGAGIAMAKRPRDPRRPDDDRPPPGIGHNSGQTPEPDPNRGPQPPIVPVVPQDRTPTQAEKDAQREFEFRKLARKYQLKENSETSRRLIENLDMPVREFIAKYRRAGIRGEFPGELLDGTVRDALASGNSTARKLLIRERFGK